MLLKSSVPMSKNKTIFCCSYIPSLHTSEVECLKQTLIKQQCVLGIIHSFYEN